MRVGHPIVSLSLSLRVCCYTDLLCVSVSRVLSNAPSGLISLLL